MSSRRQFLLSVANLEKYREYLFNYVYYSVIPSVIDSKNVKDKGKTKLLELQGNGEIVNQLCPLWVSGSYGSVDFTASNGGKTITLSGTASGYIVYTKNLENAIPKGHIILVSMNVSNPNNVFFGYRLRNASEVDYSGNNYLQIYTATKEITQLQLYGNPNIDYTGVSVSDDMIIDLSHEYGIGLEPTSLSDPRIQRILNGEHIPHNTGEYRESIVSEIELAPYNLFDGELEAGIIYSGGTESSSISDGIKSKNYIDVMAGGNYTLEESNLSNVSFRFIAEYDENKNFIQRIAGNTAFALSQNTHYIKFCITFSPAISTLPTNPQISFHRTGTRTGYAKNETIPLNLNNCHSLLGNQTGLTKGGTSSSSSVIMINNKNFYYAWSYTSNPFNITTKAHKYFTYISFTNSISKKFSISIGVNGTNIQSTKYWNDTTERKEAYAILNNTNSTITKIENMWLYANGNANYFNSDIDYPNKYFIIDLNDYGLQDLTDEQVYQLLKDNDLIDFLASGGYVESNVLSKITLPAPLQLGGAMNSHNTFKITPSGYVFTRKTLTIDVHTLTFNKYEAGGSWLFYANVSGGRTSVGQGNAVCLLNNKYACYYYARGGTTTAGGDDKVCNWDANNSQVLIKDTTYTTATDFNNSTIGQTLTFELATPQVITISRKHLKVVEISSLLSSQSVSSSGAIQISLGDIKISSSYVVVPNFLFCPLFINATYTQTYNAQVKNSISSVNGVVCIQSDNFIGKTIQEVKSMLSGQYLWYETTNEVADFVDKTNFERGGTITTNEFIWVENQLINPTLATQTLNGITITNNGDGSFTLSGRATDTTYFVFYQSTWNNHYYLFKGLNYPNNDVRWYDNYYGSYYSNKDFIFKQTNSLYTQMRISIRIENGVNLSTPFTFFPQLVDLTEGFSAGKEPTSIDDWRIQFILKNGYIPTNTEGTLKSVNSETLPNVEMNINAK